VISAAFVQEYAQYNYWQNNQLLDALKDVDEEVFGADRGAFFGTILGTLSHILWGDTIWMSRLSDGIAPPDTPGTQSAYYLPSGKVWAERRAQMDQHILHWAAGLDDKSLAGDEHWYSGAIQRDVVKPRWLCVSHMFNHQTHHRGQVSQMLHAAGLTPPVSDIVFMPKDL
jgi:uncharacterized damage-inducible protein DinB